MANLSKEQLLDGSRIRRQNRYFSVEFKIKVVKELDRGEITVKELMEEYEVSRTSIYKWIYKYSMFRKRGTKQVVESDSDTRKIQLLKQKIKELERIVGQKQFEIEFKEKMIEIADEEFGIDIKKKFGSQAWSGSGETDKKEDQ